LLLFCHQIFSVIVAGIISSLAFSSLLIQFWSVSFHLVSSVFFISIAHHNQNNNNNNNNN